MGKAKCPYCNADVNRFLPEKIYVKKDNIPWYKPDLMNIRIVCSECKKCIQYKIASIMDFLPFLICMIPLMSRMWKENPEGFYIYSSVLSVLILVLCLHQIFAERIYTKSKRQI